MLSLMLTPLPSSLRACVSVCAQLSVAGTSCSSPTFAGIMALMIDVILAAGYPPLGFLNPFIYQYGQIAFNDVTTGNSMGCNGTASGWAASKYWDPVTGWGTPNWPAWNNLVGVGM